MKQVWTRAADGRISVVVGEPVPVATTEGVRPLRVPCDLPRGPLGPLLEAQNRARRQLGRNRPDSAVDRFRTGLRRTLLGETAPDDALSEIVATLNQLADAAGTPRALVLDPVEAADPATIAALIRLIERPGWLKMPLVLGIRDRHPTGPAAALVAAVERAVGADAVLRFGGDDDDDDEPPARPSLPTGLPPLIRRLLRAAALAGPAFEVRVVAELLRLDELDVLELLQAAVDHGVPLEDDGEGGFRLSPIIAEALRAELLPSLARAWHRTLAGLYHPAEPEPGPRASGRSSTPPLSQPPGSHPGASQPGVSQPGASQPGAFHPSASQPGASQPGAPPPGASHPGASHPGASYGSASPVPRPAASAPESTARPAPPARPAPTRSTAPMPSLARRPSPAAILSPVTFAPLTAPPFAVAPEAIWTAVADAEQEQARAASLEAALFAGGGVEGAGAPSERMASDRMTADRMAADRMASDRMASDRMASDRMISDRMASMDSMPSDRPSSSRPSSDRSDRSPSDRMASDRMADRQASDRPSSDRQPSDRPPSDRPPSDRPPSDRMPSMPPDRMPPARLPSTRATTPRAPDADDRFAAGIDRKLFDSLESPFGSVDQAPGFPDNAPDTPPGHPSRAITDGPAPLMEDEAIADDSVEQSHPDLLDTSFDDRLDGGLADALFHRAGAAETAAHGLRDAALASAGFDPANAAEPLTDRRTLLGDRGRRDPDHASDAARAADHLAAAGDPTGATAKLIQAAVDAAGIGAAEQALALLDDALAALDRLPDNPAHRALRARALAEAARVQWTSVGPDARFTLESAREAAAAAEEALPEDAPAALRGEIVSLRAHILHDVGGDALEEALALLTAASLRLEDDGEPIEAARLFNDQAAIWVRLGDPVRAHGLLEASRKVFASRADHDPLALLELADTEHLIARLPLHVAARPGRERDAAALGLRHAASAEASYAKLDRPWDRARTWETAGRLELMRGRIDRAIEHLERAATLQQQLGDVLGLAATVEALARALTAAGRPQLAVALLHDSLALNAEKGSLQGIGYLRRTLAMLIDAMAAEHRHAMSAPLAAFEAEMNRVEAGMQPV